MSMGSNTLLSVALIVLDGTRCYMTGISNVITTIFLLLVIAGQCFAVVWHLNLMSRL